MRVVEVRLTSSRRSITVTSDFSAFFLSAIFSFSNFFIVFDIWSNMGNNHKVIKRGYCCQDTARNSSNSPGLIKKLTNWKCRNTTSRYRLPNGTSIRWPFICNIYLLHLFLKGCEHLIALCQRLLKLRKGIFRISSWLSWWVTSITKRRNCFYLKNLERDASQFQALETKLRGSIKSPKSSSNNNDMAEKWDLFSYIPDVETYQKKFNMLGSIHCWAKDYTYKK